MRYSIGDIRANFNDNLSHVVDQKVRAIPLPDNPDHLLTLLATLVKTAGEKMGLKKFERFNPGKKVDAMYILGTAEEAFKEGDVSVEPLRDKVGSSPAAKHQKAGIYFFKGGEIAYWISLPIKEQPKARSKLILLPNMRAKKSNRPFIMTNVPMS